MIQIRQSLEIGLWSFFFFFAGLSRDLAFLLLKIMLVASFTSEGVLSSAAHIQVRGGPGGQYEHIADVIDILSLVIYPCAICFLCSDSCLRLPVQQ